MPPSHSRADNAPAYRPDIDGLRALAVLSVIIFHAFPLWLGGGFVGVDVFFVISGFLITGIILDHLANNHFRFGTFYAGRIRRIFPALLIVLAACFAAGWYVLLGDEFKRLGKHIAGSAGFITNFLMWQESGYFDPSSVSKPLLHLWSLGIEEQFYLLWPALLWITHKMRLSTIGLVIAAGFTSLAANLMLANDHSVADFYSPLTRYWELMAGGMLAVHQSHKQSSRHAHKKSQLQLDILSVCGILLVFASLAGFNRSMAFPSWRAMVPVLGASFLIFSGSHSFINRHFLSQRLMVGIGLISYPLYLWHWPLLCFTHIFEDRHAPYLLRIAALTASIILAWLTYIFVEKPIRFGQRKTGVIVLLCMAMVGTGACGYWVFLRDGMTFRDAAQTSKELHYDIAARRAEIDHEFGTIPCLFSDTIVPTTIKDYCSQYGRNDAKRTIVIWGDSHADSWALAIDYLAKKRGDTRVIMFRHQGCPPLIGVRRTAQADGQDFCRDQMQGATIVAAIRNLKPDLIVLVARWSLYTKGQRYTNGGLQPDYRQITTFLTDSETPNDHDAMQTTLGPTLEALSSIANLLIIKNVPVLLGDVNAAISAQTTTHSANFMKQIEPTLAQHQLLSEHAYHLMSEATLGLPNVTIFDPAPFMCRDTCKAIKDGTLMYRDDAHPSAEGVLLLAHDLEPFLEAAY